MSDDLNKKINQISEMLGQENMPDNVKNLISLLASSLSGNKEPEHEHEANKNVTTDEKPQSSNNSTTTNRSDSNDDEMVRRVKTVLDRFGSNNDPRINLLTAIRPFLNNNRQDKVSNCIKILRMSSLARLIDDPQVKGNFLPK